MLRLLFYVALIAAIVYAVLWLLDRRARGNAAAPSIPAGPKGPDDDPEFLWGLDKDRRHPGQPHNPEDPQA